MKKIIISVCIALALLVGTFYAISASKNDKNLELQNEKNIARQNAYAKADEPALIDFMDTNTISDALKGSNLVIRAESLGYGDKIESEPNITPNTPEAAINEKNIKNGNEIRGMRFKQVRLKVNEVLSGECNLEEITLVQPEIGEGYEPELLTGDKALLFLRKHDVNGRKDTYAVCHPHSSYIYINKGDKVNPICKEGELGELSGKSLEKTEELIKDSIEK